MNPRQLEISIRSVLVVACCTIAFFGSAHAAQAQFNDGVESGQRAFNNQGDWSWYDNASDSLRPVQPPAAQSSSDGRQGNGRGGSGRGGGSGQAGTGGGSSNGFQAPAGPSNLGNAIGPVISAIAIVVLVILLVAVVVGIICMIMKMDFSKDDELGEEIDENEEVELAPVDKLPFEIDPSVGNFLEAARRAYNQQDYRKATIYLFSFTLLTLDQHGMVRLTRGKTNRQYLAEIRQFDELRKYYEQIMITFEQAFFGNVEISRGQFEASWTRFEQFRQDIQRYRQPAAFPQPQLHTSSA